jgi:hypothetical protein
METSKKTVKAIAALRSELPASPDAGVTETLNLSTADVVEFIESTNNDNLELVQELAELEAHNRTPEGRGELTFRKAYRTARKAYRSSVAAATELLEVVEGALLEFFEPRCLRDSDIDMSLVRVLADGEPTIAASTMIIKDPKLGRLRAELQSYYRDEGNFDSVRVVIRNRWGKTLLWAGGEGGGATAAIEEFAYWAARQ